MRIIIQSPDIKARTALLEFVNEKVKKLGGITDRLLEARVTLKLNKSDTRENKVCEIRMAIPGNDLFTEKDAGSFEEAVRKAADAMKRQITDWKVKTRPHTGSGFIMEEETE